MSPRGRGSDKDAERWMATIATAAEACTDRPVLVTRLKDSTAQRLHVSVSLGQRSTGIEIEWFEFSSDVVLELGRRLLVERLSEGEWSGLWIYAAGLAEEEAILAEEGIDIDDYTSP